MKAQKNLNNHRFTKEQEVEIETYYTKLFNENNYGMRVKFNDIYKILSSGKFKNQIETEASGGAFTPTKRKYLSNKWFGTPDNTNPEDYEKYGYLCNSNLIEEFYGDFENKTSIYRNVLVVFKKENVKYRTTFTNGDSLNADFKSRNFSPSYTHTIHLLVPKLKICLIIQKILNCQNT